MKNYKILSSHCDFESGISTVTIGTDLGAFTGVSPCQDADRENFSQFFGCEIAELKAWRKYAKARKAVENTKLKALKEYAYRMEHTRNFDPSAYWYKQLIAEIAETSSRREQWSLTMERISQGIQRTIIARDLGLKRLNRK